ncbi:MAG: (2Fe-2S)-binding protein [Synergistota bacterium]|nr:(2Fe-2S)-binding protein [Synergistota bacterium]
MDEKVNPGGREKGLALIEEHPILDFQHGKKVRFIFDGDEFEGFEGEPISTALHANGVRIYRTTADMHRPRGFFCAIGKCSSCFMVVNGVPNVRTCITPLTAGMVVETQRGNGVVPDVDEGSGRS